MNHCWRRFTLDKAVSSYRYCDTVSQREAGFAMPVDIAEHVGQVSAMSCDLAKNDGSKRQESVSCRATSCCY